MADGLSTLVQPNEDEYDPLAPLPPSALREPGASRFRSGAEDHQDDTPESEYAFGLDFGREDNENNLFDLSGEPEIEPNSGGSSFYDRIRNVTTPCPGARGYPCNCRSFVRCPYRSRQATTAPPGQDIRRFRLNRAGYPMSRTAVEEESRRLNREPPTPPLGEGGSRDAPAVENRLRREHFLRRESRERRMRLNWYRERMLRDYREMTQMQNELNDYDNPSSLLSGSLEGDNSTLGSLETRYSRVLRGLRRQRNLLRSNRRNADNSSSSSGSSNGRRDGLDRHMYSKYPFIYLFIQNSIL